MLPDLGRWGTRLAVVDERSLTYAELQERASRLAALLIETQSVVLLTPSGAGAVVALVASLQAGVVAVPIDAEEPEPRLRRIYHNLGRPLVVSCGSALARAVRLAGPGRVMDLEQLPMASRPPVPIPDGAALLLHTSGTTGAPNAVAHWRTGLQKLVEARRLSEPIGPDERLTLLSSPAVMGFTSTVLSALDAGATLFPRDLRHEPIDTLPDWLARHEITRFFSVPSIFRALARLPDLSSRLKTLRFLQFSGEPLRNADLALVASLKLPDLVLRNGLSSTETGPICRRFYPSSELLDPAVSLSFGQPLPGVELEITDAAGHPLPFGEPGELWVRTPWMARGYHLNPALTAHRFRSRAGQPIFRTGDRARLDQDGLTHLDRSDRQVKIRGTRVELGEIEDRLRDLPGVTEARAVQSVSGQLLAFVEMPGEAATGIALRQQLSQALPGPFLPEKWSVQSLLPRTASGKIDVTRLTEIEMLQSQESSQEVDIRISSAWMELLRPVRFDCDQDFFALGGDSILALRLCARLTAEGLPLSTDDLLAAPTPRALMERASLGPLVPLKPDGNGSHIVFLAGSGGELTPFAQFGRQLGSSTWGLRSPWKNPGEMSLSQTIAAYSEAIRPLRGPLRLVGFSSGGLLALELARNLQEQGRSVDQVVLLDTHADPIASDSGWLSALGRLLTVGQLLASLRPGQWPALLRQQWDGYRQRADRHTVPGSGWWAARRAEGFQIQPYRGRTLLIRASHQPWGTDPRLGWSRYLSHLEVRCVISLHDLTMLRPPVFAEVAQLISE